MPLHRTLLAIAASALIVGPAFAGSADIYNLTASGDSVLTSGYADVFGEVAVSSKSAAVVNQTQASVINASQGDGSHAADLTGNALRGASGNIGVNVGAGVGNAQSNDAALSTVDGNRVFASAMVFADQASIANYGASTFPGNTYYSAVMNGDALRGARGNIGVNVAAGVGNVQSNGMAASVNTSGRLAIASTDANQFTTENLLETDWDLDSFAILGGNALANAQGNIGVNIAAGVGNLQHNSIAIASSSD